jgi:hypothetical protein
MKKKAAKQQNKKVEQPKQKDKGKSTSKKKK